MDYGVLRSTNAPYDQNYSSDLEKQDKDKPKHGLASIEYLYGYG